MVLRQCLGQIKIKSLRIFVEKFQVESMDTVLHSIVLKISGQESLVWKERNLRNLQPKLSLQIQNLSF